jgi:hypothetical protein
VREGEEVSMCVCIDMNYKDEKGKRESDRRGKGKKNELSYT